MKVPPSNRPPGAPDPDDLDLDADSSVSVSLNESLDGDADGNLRRLGLRPEAERKRRSGEKRRRKKRRKPRRRPDEDAKEQVVDVFDEGDYTVASREHLFRRTSGQPEPGDPTLVDPENIRRIFGSPVGYAKHVMILAEAFRRITGADRAEALDYLARMFLASGDMAFGRTALKEFGPSTGILDIYPLEIVEHVLVHYPGFLPKMGFGRLFPRETDTMITDTETVLLLHYSVGLKIRGFALRGGGHPGYYFGPAEEAGVYELEIHQAGAYELLVSGVTRSGHTLIERVRIVVRGKAPAAERPSPYPIRQPEKVAAWYQPEVPDLDVRDLLETVDESNQGKMSAAEIIHHQSIDAGGRLEDSGPHLFDDPDENTSPESIDASPFLEEDQALALDLLDAGALLGALHSEPEEDDSPFAPTAHSLQEIQGVQGESTETSTANEEEPTVSAAAFVPDDVAPTTTAHAPLPVARYPSDRAATVLRQPPDRAETVSAPEQARRPLDRADTVTPEPFDPPNTHWLVAPTVEDQPIDPIDEPTPEVLDTIKPRRAPPGRPRRPEIMSPANADDPTPRSVAVQKKDQRFEKTQQVRMRKPPKGGAGFDEGTRRIRTDRKKKVEVTQAEVEAFDSPRPARFVDVQPSDITKQIRRSDPHEDEDATLAELPEEE